MPRHRFFGRKGAQLIPFSRDSIASTVMGTPEKLRDHPQVNRRLLLLLDILGQHLSAKNVVSVEGRMTSHGLEAKLIAYVYRYLMPPLRSVALSGEDLSRNTLVWLIIPESAHVELQDIFQRGTGKCQG